MKPYFKLRQRGTSVRTEFIAGMTTFFSMVYMLMVNANMFADPFGDGSNPLGVSYGAIYIATAISAVVGTILAGIISNLPLAQASGMGLNAFFVYTVCIGFGLSYANALVLILAEGIVFILLTVTGLRKKIFESLPNAVSVSIPGGIGLYLQHLLQHCLRPDLLYYHQCLLRLCQENQSQLLDHRRIVHHNVAADPLTFDQSIIFQQTF